MRKLFNQSYKRGWRAEASSGSLFGWRPEGKCIRGPRKSGQQAGCEEGGCKGYGVKAQAGDTWP